MYLKVNKRLPFLLKRR